MLMHITVDVKRGLALKARRDLTLQTENTGSYSLKLSTITTKPCISLNSSILFVPLDQISHSYTFQRSLIQPYIHKHALHISEPCVIILNMQTVGRYSI